MISRVTGHSVTVEGTRNYEQSLKANQPNQTASPWLPEAAAFSSSANEDTTTHTLTFAELKDLIEQGKTDQIPNNRVIPEALNVSELSSRCT